MICERLLFDADQAVAYLTGAEPMRGDLKIVVESKYANRTETVVFVGQYLGHSSLGRWLIMNAGRTTKPNPDDGDLRLFKYETRDGCQITVEPLEEPNAEESSSNS